MRISAGLMLAVGVASAVESAQAEGVCDIALTSQAYDTRSYSKAAQIAEQKRADLCSAEYSSEQEFRSKATQAGFTLGYGGLSLGGSGAQGSGQNRIDVKQTEFCKASESEFASAYAESYQERVASVALTAWLDCVKTVGGNRLFISYDVLPNGRSSSGSFHRTAATGSLESQIRGLVVVPTTADVTCNIGGMTFASKDALRDQPYAITETLTAFSCEKTEAWKGEDVGVAFQTSADATAWVMMLSPATVAQNRIDDALLKIDGLTKRLDEGLGRVHVLRHDSLTGDEVRKRLEDEQGRVVAEEGDFLVRTEIDAGAAGGVLIASTTGTWSHKLSTKGAREDAGVSIDVRIDGALCGADRYFYADTNKHSVHSSTTCVKFLAAREATYKLEARLVPSGGGSATDEPVLTLDYVLLSAQP